MPLLDYGSNTLIWDPPVFAHSTDSEKMRESKKANTSLRKADNHTAL